MISGHSATTATYFNVGTLRQFFGRPMRIIYACYIVQNRMPYIIPKVERLTKFGSLDVWSWGHWVQKVRCQGHGVSRCVGVLRFLSSFLVIDSGVERSQWNTDRKLVSCGLENRKIVKYSLNVRYLHSTAVTVNRLQGRNLFTVSDCGVTHQDQVSVRC